MGQVLLVASAVTIYAIGNGLMIIATPQVALRLNMSSFALGLLGTGCSLGYCVGCLALGRIFRRMPGKWVVIVGACGSGLCIYLMSMLTSVAGCFLDQLVCGVFCAAFWPFASAWMLDHQSPSLKKTRILRRYNCAWAGGTSVGMLVGGLMCQRGWLHETFWAGTACMGLCVLVALIGRRTQPRVLAEQDSRAGLRRLVPLPTVLLVAALTANLMGMGTRSLVIYNYAELNEYGRFGAERMGILVGCALAGQLVGFLLGFLYERWLGLRRVYIFVSVSLIAINFACAYSTNLALLIGAMILLGLVGAVAFQISIMAATEWFSSPRGGTTLHESIVGLGNMATLAAGFIIQSAKKSGFETLTALRAPFLIVSLVLLFALLLQLILVATRREERVLLSAPLAVPATVTAAPAGLGL